MSKVHEFEYKPESTPEVENNQRSDEQLKANLLFGTISYKDDESYENFIHNMNLSQALFVLIASANFAQAKGSFTILESEVMANAVRTIRKNSKPVQESNDPIKPE